MDFLPAGKKKVAVSGVSTVFSFAEHNQILEVYQWSDLSSLVWSAAAMTNSFDDLKVKTAGHTSHKKQKNKKTVKMLAYPNPTWSIGILKFYTNLDPLRFGVPKLFL